MFLVFFIHIYVKLNEPTQYPSGLTLIVKQGDGLNHVLLKLKRNGFFSEIWHIKLYAFAHHKQRLIKGEYFLEQGITQREVVNKLNLGVVIQRKLTIIEGWNYKQAVAHVNKIVSVEQPDLSYLLWPNYLSIDGAKTEYGMEGLIYPSTYFFTKSDTVQQILYKAHELLIKVLQQEWSGRKDNLPIKTPYEALVLASIVEKETAVPEERSKIAGVFINRLRKGMRLQSDPTVIYGLGDHYKGDLKRKHLQDKSAYNTYVIKGLPITPIALVGRASIHAVLNPEITDALYFVAKGDGTHKFSSNITEHNQAVNYYQVKKRSKNYHSTPQSNSNVNHSRIEGKK